MFEERRDKHNYYLDIAEVVLERGTCLRRKYGAIIVKNDQIISTGYAGAPRGRKNCSDLGWCRREKMNVPRGRNQQRRKRKYDRRNSLFGRKRMRKRRIRQKRKLLQHVQTPCYKCRNRYGCCPRRQQKIPHYQRERLDLQRRFP